MLQATLFNSLFLYLFPFSENGFIAAKVDVGGCDVVQAVNGGAITGHWGGAKVVQFVPRLGA